MSRTVTQVTAARRRAILEAVIFLGKTFTQAGPVTTGAVNDMLTTWIAQGIIRWPEADWPHARQEPYVGGTQQHLAAMRRQGLVAHEDGSWVPCSPTPDRLLRRHADDVLRLKSEGKTQKAIAGELGLSKSLVYSLLADPIGEREKERKRGYCPGCGAKKRSEATVCQNCQERRADELLPPQTFVTYIERARSAGYQLLFGVTPDFRRVIRIGTTRGFFEHDVRYDLSWLDGLREVAEEVGLDLD